MVADKPVPSKKRGCLVFVVAMAAIIGVTVWLAPPYSFDPLCTFNVNYRLNTTIDVDGRQYSSEVTWTNSFSRRWIQVMNSAGCKQSHGTALSFRLADNRVVLVGAGICSKAMQELSDKKDSYPREQTFSQAMSVGRKVDVINACPDTIHDANPLTRTTRPHGFVVDNADRPAAWIPFRFGEKLKNSDLTIRLVAATATATRDRATDKLDEVAPGVAKTYFEYREWWDSPERIVDFHRRHPATFKARPE